MTGFLSPPLLFAMCYVPFNKHKRVFSSLSIPVFLVSAGQQMPSWLEVEEAHGDVTPPALRGGFAESDISSPRLLLVNNTWVFFIMYVAS